MELPQRVDRAYPHGYTHAYPDEDAHADGNPYPYANADRDADADRYADTDAISYGDLYAYGNANGDADRHNYTVRDTNGDPHPHGDADSDPYRNVDPSFRGGRRRSARHADAYSTFAQAARLPAFGLARVRPPEAPFSYSTRLALHR